MACPTVATMSSVRDSIAELVSTIVHQSPEESDHLNDARTVIDNVFIALRDVEDRQDDGTQYLPDVHVLFRRTAGMLDILEKVLQDHVDGLSGGETKNTVSSMSTIFGVFRKTANLVTLYNATLEIHAAANLGEQMTGYCRVAQDVSQVKGEWRSICEGKTFDPEPIDKLLDVVKREARRYLMPTSFHKSLPTKLPPGGDDVPPSYETVFGTQSRPSPRIDEKTPMKQEKSAAPSSASKADGSQKNHKKSTDATTLDPRMVIGFPRRSRQNENVRVALTPDASQIVVWSVDCVELYCSGRATRFWRLDSDNSALSSKGVPCQFLDLKCFSPDGSLVGFAIAADRAEELVIIRVRDGQVRGKRPFSADQHFGVCISNSNRKIAVCCKSAKQSKFGSIMLLPIDSDEPGWQCLTGGAMKVDQATEEPGEVTVVSCFTPNDSHLVVASEVLKPIRNASSRMRTTILNVFEAKGGTEPIINWETSQGKSYRQPAFNPEFLFPRDESTGKHKWLMAWNGENMSEPATFKLGDIAHKEIYATIREGVQNLSIFQVFGTLTKTMIYSKIRFFDDVWTHVVRRGKKSQAKITLTRGKWDQHGLSSPTTNSIADSPAAMLLIGVDDDWQISSDGRFAVTYSKEKARVELWSL